MKGLLLKDFMMMGNYCRTILVVSVALLLGSIGSFSNGIFLIMPFVLASEIPLVLIIYDEQEKWDKYSGTLPYSKAQLVSGKYLVNCILDMILLVIYMAVQAGKMIAEGNFNVDGWLFSVVPMFLVGVLMPALMLPFIFRFGAKKGRMVWMASFMIMFALIGSFQALLKDPSFTLPAFITEKNFLVLAVLVAIGIYAVSWLLSVAFYKKREL